MIIIYLTIIIIYIMIVDVHGIFDLVDIG